MAEIQENLLVEALSEREREIIHLIDGGLSNREIGENLFISYETVKWYNKRIYAKLGVGKRTQAVAKAREFGLLEDVFETQKHVQVRVNHNLPAQITSFVGRENEVAKVTKLLNETHLLTLTGPGGTGKTRLAIEAAKRLLGLFQNGILFVNLAPINQPNLIPSVIASSLGLNVSANQAIVNGIKEYLSDKEILLILDNFEHIIEAAPIVGELLSATQRSKFLITSREALNLYGEQLFPVPILTLPDLAQNLSLNALSDNEAVKLFVERVRAVKPDFSLKEENAPAVAEITVRLDGLPLAIELAAARMKMFSPHSLLGQLDSRLQALGKSPRDLPDRQRTLHDTITWSHNLLNENEQILFARLSAFQGGRTIDAVEDVCCIDLSLDVLDGLESLLNKNLIQQIDGPEDDPRFIMLETIHEYARNQLEERGEAREIKGRHAEYFTLLAERVAPEVRAGPTQMAWLRRLQAEHDNLRTALEWSFSGASVQLGLRLVSALGYFWFRQGHYLEGKYWTTRAVEFSEDAPPAIRAGVLHAAGLAGHYLHEPELGKSLHQQSLALYREIGDQREVGWVLIQLAIHSVGNLDEYEEAITLCEEGLSILREVNDLGGVAQALNMIGELSRLYGDTKRAKEAYTECLEVAREIGDKLREGIQLINLAFLAHADDNFDQAENLVLQGMQIALAIDHLPLIIHFLSALALPLGGLGKLDRAAQLIGASEGIIEKHGIIHQPSDQPVYDESKAFVRKELGAEQFDAAYEQGRAMNLEEAIVYSMESHDE